MKGIPPIKAVMTAFPYSIEADAPVSEARRMMTEHDIRHLPVIQRGKLFGVISDRDIELAMDPELGVPPEGLPVSSACTKHAYVVDRAEPLDRVLSRMARDHLGAALVVKEGRLVGIFTMTDACRRFADLLLTLFPRGGDDAA